MNLQETLKSKTKKVILNSKCKKWTLNPKFTKELKHRNWKMNFKIRYLKELKQRIFKGTSQSDM